MYQQKFDINNSTQLSDDACFRQLSDKDNQIIADRPFQPYLSDNDPTRHKYLDSFNQAGVFQTGNYAGLPNFIDNDSAVRQGRYGGILTHDQTKQTNPASTRFNPPFKGAQTMALDTDTMSRLYSGELTHDKAYPLREKVIDRFVPLIPEIESEIQNPNNLVPRYWVRGGMDTKTVVRNIDYLKTCGLKR